MNKICCVFFEDKDNIKDALRRLDKIEDYGSTYVDENKKTIVLYTWDDGGRFLTRCSECGNYVLVQKSEIHLLEEDVYYTDYIAVDSPKHAQELNKNYNGFEIENDVNLPIIFFREGIFQTIRNLNKC